MNRWEQFGQWHVVWAFFLCSALSVALLPGALFAYETIPSFDARISVHTNASIEVTERITYDFGTAERHGIFRVIPYSYQAGDTTYEAPISGVLVTAPSGAPVPFNESRDSGELTLKIGDPNKTVTGTQTYVINYVVKGPFLYFAESDELYWNVTGKWPTSIEEATVLVELPSGAEVLDARCYAGPENSPQPCATDQKLFNDERAAYGATATNLAQGEALTVAVAFPKETIIEHGQPWDEERKPVLTGNWQYAPFSIPLVVLFGMFALWYTRGRDPKGQSTVVTEFTPPDDLAPSVAGVVYNEQSDDAELSAEMVRLAVEGFVRIHRFEEKLLWFFNVTEYVFEFLETERQPDSIQELLLIKLRQAEFQGTKEKDGQVVHGALISKMKQRFTQEKKEIVSRIYEEVARHRYFVARPDKVRTTYVVAGIVVFGLGLLTVTIGHASMKAIVFAGAMALSGLIIAFGGVWMPARTKEGVRIKRHLEGFKRYLEVAEKDRLAFHNAPEKTPELFDRYLPYAIAFGVEEAWTEQFANIYTEPPKWYSGSGSFAHGFAVGALTSDLASFSSDFAAASAPQSSGAGGGGSVGGGFGGGGGGSW